MLFSTFLTTRNRSNSSRGVLERRDSSRTWPVSPILAGPTHLNLSGRALVSSICADSRGICYIHDPRFPELPSADSPKKPRGYTLWEDRSGAASLSVSLLGTVLSYRHYREAHEINATQGTNARPRDTIKVYLYGLGIFRKISVPPARTLVTVDSVIRRTVLSAAIIRALFISHSYLLVPRSLRQAPPGVRSHLGVALVKFGLDNRIGPLCTRYPARLMQYARFTNRPLQLADV